MADKLNEQELYDFAVTTLPPAGVSIVYADWLASVKSSPQPAAANFYREMKRRGVVKSRIELTEDNKIVHTIERV